MCIIYAYKCIYPVYIMSSINKGSLIGCPQQWELSPTALLLPLNFSLLFLGKLSKGQAQAGK